MSKKDTAISLLRQEIADSGKGTPDPSALGVGGSGEGRTLISCPSEVVKTVGPDTVHLSLWLDCERSFNVFDILGEAKKAVQSGSDREIEVTLSQSSIFTWSLQRTGSAMYPFILKSGDVSLSLANRRHDTNMPNAQFCIGSLSCNQSPMKIWQQLKCWLELLKFKVVREQCCRFDLCADLAYDIKASYLHYLSNYVCRARNINLYTTHREVSGVMIGKGAIVMRGYNKPLEMKEKRNIEKMLFFQQLWKLPPKVTEVTRIEFQLRSEFLREVFPEGATLADVLGAQYMLWKYLTTKWCRHTIAPVDKKNKNQSRAETSQFWKLVQQAACPVDDELDRVKKQKHVNIHDLIRQARGCMTTVVAALGIHKDNKECMVRTIQRIIGADYKRYMDSSDFRRKYDLKQATSVVCF